MVVFWSLQSAERLFDSCDFYLDTYINSMLVVGRTIVLNDRRAKQKHAIVVVAEPAFSDKNTPLHSLRLCSRRNASNIGGRRRVP